MQSFSNFYQMYKWLMYKNSSFPAIVIQFEDNRIIRASYSRLCIIQYIPIPFLVPVIAPFLPASLYISSGPFRSEIINFETFSSSRLLLRWSSTSGTISHRSKALCVYLQDRIWRKWLWSTVRYLGIPYI